MELYIGGGCGEHGRNCFYFAGRQTSVIVDCGLRAGSLRPYPRLTKEQIQTAGYLFLTHSHNDHSGALNWLLSNGFHGQVIMTAATRTQLAATQKLSNILLIDQVTAPLQDFAITNTLTVNWGRSGHCTGSCWYRLRLEGKLLLCSGDYIEDTLAYRCDPIRGQSADLAIIDSAYGNAPASPAAMRQDFVSTVELLLRQKNILLLPVPRYGRNLEILLTLEHLLPFYTFFADRHLLNELKNSVCLTAWLKPEALPALQNLPVKNFDYDWPLKAGVYLLSDPQLKQTDNFRLAGSLLSSGNILCSGFMEPDGNAKKLFDAGLVQQCSYPVHNNNAKLRQLVRDNSFGNVVANHCSQQADPFVLTF